MNVTVDFIQENRLLLSLLFYIANNYHGHKFITPQSAT
jgi:hypothetical protein